MIAYYFNFLIKHTNVKTEEKSLNIMNEYFVINASLTYIMFVYENL